MIIHFACTIKNKLSTTRLKLFEKSWYENLYDKIISDIIIIIIFNCCK